MLEARKTQQAVHAERVAARRDASHPAPQAIDETIVFNGTAGAIIGLILRNVIFSILTLGIYSFRSKSRLRRHFLGKTAFLGNRFEYVGTGTKLFVGHAAVMLALAGLTAAFVAALKDPSILGDLPIGQQASLVGAGFLYFISMLFIFHFAALRANRRFLAQIKWRNFSPRQTGSAFGYASRAVPLSLLVVLTLGLAYPFMRNRLQIYKINHARFGQERLRYHGDTGPLFRFWLLPWSIGVTLIVGIVTALETQVKSLANASWIEDANLPVHAWNTFVEEQTWLVLLGFVLFSFAMHWYRSVEAQHLAHNTSLAQLRFVSQITHADSLIAWVNSVVLVVILGAAGVATFLAIGSATVAFAGNGPAVGYAIATLILLILAVITLLLGSVKWLILHNLLAGASAGGLAIKGRIALDRLMLNQAPASTRSEPAPDMNPDSQSEKPAAPGARANNPL